MKKYPKSVTCDERGQLVIPRDIRNALGISEGTGFWTYTIVDEGILLKKIEVEQFHDDEVLEELSTKSDRLQLKKENLKKTVNDYKKRMDGNLEVI